MNQFIQSEEFLFIGIFLSSFITTLLLIPRIRNTTLKLGFIDNPDSRSSHTNSIPTLGGIAFYISLILTLFILQKKINSSIIITLLVSLSIIFFTGLKDDLKNISPKIKMMGQLIAVSLLMIHSEFYIFSLHGFLGIHELPTFIGIPISIFLLIAVINAYNLIDGIDGLASIVGIVVAFSFAMLFYNLELYSYVSICIALISMLLAFLRYNFSERKKIFMGDTGSLVIGFFLGLLGLRLLSLDFDTLPFIAIPRNSIPLLVLAILIVPTFDVSRVIFIRVIKKMSITSPDRNHIHHLLIDTGLSHKKASLLVGGVNFFIVFLMYFSLKIGGFNISIILFCLLFLVFSYLFLVINKGHSATKIKIKIKKKTAKFINFFSL